MRLARVLGPLVVLGLLAGILATTDRFPAADGPHMLAQAMRLGAWIREGDPRALTEMLQLTAPHPPVGYLPMTLAAVVSRDVRAIVTFSDVVWAIVLLDGMARIARPWWAGQVAWAMGMAASMTWWSADHAGFDLAAAATIVQAVSRLSYERPVAAGAWMAAAFLTKYSAPLVLFLPALLSARPRREVLVALAVFVAIAGPYYALNWASVSGYVASALNPPLAPGNFPESRTLFERFGGEGQRMFLTVLRDQLGWPALVVLALGAVAGRRWLPLAGVASGIVFLGAMNSREARYALPMVFLLCAAGAPVLRFGWQHLVGLVALTLPTLRATASEFASCGAACAPATRVFEVDAGTLAGWGRWPSPPEAFRPVSEPVAEWHVAEIARAAVAVPSPVLVVAISDQLMCPKASVFMLVLESLGSDLPVNAVHTLGAQVNDYIGPFAPAERAAPHVGYVITGTPGEDAWLAAHPGEELRRWSLPGGHTGVLVRW